MTRATFFCLLCLTGIRLFAGNDTSLSEKRLKFEYLTINDGLSQGMVTCILQDRFGFLWFATKDGLNRYDGYHFTVFRHNPADSSSLADNYITALFEDSKGRLWVGTASQGFDLFSFETEKFRHFGPVISPVERMVEDKTGNIWIGTFSDLWVMQETKTKDQHPVFNLRRIEDQPTQIVAVSDGSIWVSTNSGLLYVVRNYGEKQAEFDTIAEVKYSCPGQPGESYVREFVEDRNRQKLYLFTKNSIATFDERQQSFTRNCRSWPDTKSFLTKATLHPDGSVWIRRSFTITQYIPGKNEWYLITDFNRSSRLIDDFTSCMFTDRSGLIWIGTTGYGLLKHYPRTEKFHHVVTEHPTTRNLSEAENGTLLQVKDGDFVQQFNTNEGRYTGMFPDNSAPGFQAYKNTGTTNAAIADGKNYWISTDKLFSVNRQSKKITGYDKRAFPLFKAMDGNLWFGDRDSFTCYNERRNTFTSFKFPTEVSQAPYNFLEAIYQDKDSIFWLGTTRGLLRFDPVNATWKHYKNKPGDSTSLSFDVLFSICPDPGKLGQYLWIGTNGGGLNRFDKQTGQVKRYTTTTGLANDVVYCILNDDSGNLWMSTNKGLSKLNLGGGQFHNYDFKEGLQSNEFNRNAFCKMRNGTLCFGGVNGFNYFLPGEIRDNTLAPQVQITNFRVINKTVDFKERNSPLSRSIYLTHQLTLPFAANMLSFDFAALDYTRTEKNSFKYKLEGFDNNWISTTGTNTATYTNLNPGNYKFIVKACNADGIWNEEGTFIELTVVPPWYMTWWFRSLVAMVVILLLYLFYRYRLQQIVRLQNLRNNIARDLHDEIGSNLSTISIFTDMLQAKAKEEKQDTLMLDKINEYTRTSMEAMGDIVWMINTRNDRFENVIVKMRRLAIELFETKNCLLHLNFSDSLNGLKLGMDAHKNFYLVYKEALNNIAKYADCKNVWIEMSMVNSSLLLTIKDDGKGFELSNNLQGNGLSNMKKRAEILKGELIIKSKVGEGTGIQLKFSP